MQHVRSVAGTRVDYWNYGRNDTIHADVMPCRLICSNSRSHPRRQPIMDEGEREHGI
jgi:hypothetical protein